MTDILERCSDYLKNGGLFNPELMDHNKVRDLVTDCRDEIETLRLQVAALEASLVSSLETAIHQALAGVVESDESDGDEWFGFEETVKFVKNYDRMYGALHIKEDYDGKFWLKERMFAAVDVEWTTIYGPLSEDQIQELKNTGKICP